MSDTGCEPNNFHLVMHDRELAVIASVRVVIILIMNKLAAAVRQFRG